MDKAHDTRSNAQGVRELVSDDEFLLGLFVSSFVPRVLESLWPRLAELRSPSHDFSKVFDIERVDLNVLNRSTTDEAASRENAAVDDYRRDSTITVRQLVRVRGA